MLDIKTYTLKQVSEILSVTERTLFKYLKSGKLRGQKIGGKWQISESNLRKFVNGGVEQDDATWILLICKVSIRGKK